MCPNEHVCHHTNADTNTNTQRLLGDACKLCIRLLWYVRIRFSINLWGTGPLTSILHEMKDDKILSFLLCYSGAVAFFYAYKRGRKKTRTTWINRKIAQYVQAYINSFGEAYPIAIVFHHQDVFQLGVNAMRLQGNAFGISFIHQSTNLSTKRLKIQGF